MDLKAFIVGSIGNEPEGVEPVLELLRAPVRNLKHGDEFTGKPVTRIHLSESHVLKINSSGAFTSREIASAWCSKVLKKEKESALYHPRKTWFVLFEEGVWRVGNITPRMSPLHAYLEQCDAGQSLGWLLKVTDLYLHHAVRSQERLDEGLSNFGVTGSGELYYLDDDFYSWDYFLCFTAMIAGWLRQYSATWLSDELAGEFGRKLARQLVDIFADMPGVAPLNIVYEHLGSHYVNEKADSRVKAFRAELIRSESRKGDLGGEVPISVKVAGLDEACLWLEEDEPVAVLADIHANEPALLRVLDDLDRKGIKRVICLGDIVGYGPHPTRCIDLLRSVGAFCIRGNHDHMVGSGKPVPSMHGSGLHAAEWTISQIGEEHRDWLLALPLQLRYSPWLAVHGAPQDPTFFNGYVYQMTAESNLHWLNAHEFKFCMHGHSHLQGCYFLRNGEAVRQSFTTNEVVLEGVSLICPGSVGQPRGGCPDAEYSVIRPVSKTLQMRRCSYNIEATVRDMAEYCLPDQLIERLWQGR